MLVLAQSNFEVFFSEISGAEVALMVLTEVVMILQEAVVLMYPEVAVDEARMEPVGVGDLVLLD